MLVNGKVLCQASLRVVETTEKPEAFVCQNCDNNLRDKGRAIRPKVVRTKADYVPRHKFKE